MFCFSALFTTALHKNETTFDVVELSSDSIEWIIKFAYLRDVSFINDSNAKEILIIADYFGILRLLKTCVDFIIKALTPENCIGYWLTARYVFHSYTMVIKILKIHHPLDRHRCIHRLLEHSWNYILENFIRIANVSKELLSLNVDDFFTIINDELLNVKVWKWNVEQ